MDYREMIRKYLDDEIETLNRLDVEAVNAVMQQLEAARERGGTIYIFGNDFNKGVSEHTEKKFNFLCLNDNIATLMAVANDIGFEEVFRFQLTGHLKPGDLVVAISGSGNSKNVLNAVEDAKAQGNAVIGVTGYDGGKLAALADYHLHAPVMSMQITEDVHMIFDHLMMSIFYKTLCGIEHLKR